MTDPFTAGKRALEDEDRTRMLAADARARLNRLDDWPSWPRELVVDELLDLMSWPDAIHVLDFIDWEDKHDLADH